MRVLLTGSEGYIGSETRRALELREHTVFGFDRVKGMDIRNAADLCDAFDEFRPDAVIHLAASAIVDDTINPRVAEEVFAVNASGTRNVVATCRQYGCRRLIYASTGSVYGETRTHAREYHMPLPQSVYAISKLAGEHFVESSDLNWTILRYFNVLGGAHASQTHLLPNILRAIRDVRGGHWPQLKLFGNAGRDYVAVEDVAELNARLVEGGTAETRSAGRRSTLNVCSERLTSTQDLLQLACKLLNDGQLIPYKQVAQLRPGDLQYSYGSNEALIANLRSIDYVPCTTTLEAAITQAYAAMSAENA